MSKRLYLLKEMEEIDMASKVRSIKRKIASIKEGKSGYKRFGFRFCAKKKQQTDLERRLANISKMDKGE